MAKAKVPKKPHVLKRWSKLRKHNLLDLFPEQWQGLGYAPRRVKFTRQTMEYYEYQRSTCPLEWCREAIDIADFCLHHQGKAFLVFCDNKTSFDSFLKNSKLHIVTHPRQMEHPMANQENMPPLPPPTPPTSPPYSPPQSLELSSFFPSPPPEAQPSDWWL